MCVEVASFCSGHCLALTLLGSYLSDAYDGDIHFRDEVSGHLAHNVRQGVHLPEVTDVGRLLQRVLSYGADIHVIDRGVRQLFRVVQCGQAVQAVVGCLLSSASTASIEVPPVVVSPTVPRS